MPAARMAGIDDDIRHRRAVVIPAIDSACNRAEFRLENAHGTFYSGIMIGI
jgi:hypothetical protein